MRRHIGSTIRSTLVCQILVSLRYLLGEISWGGPRLIIGTGAHGSLPVMAEVVEKAHPKAWVRGQAVPGRFYAGALWGSSTLAWDAAWFRAQGVKMPKGAHYVMPGRDTIPLTDKLDPTDTGVMRRTIPVREVRTVLHVTC
jgi:hypothetical protein